MLVEQFAFVYASRRQLTSNGQQILEEQGFIDERLVVDIGF